MSHKGRLGVVALLAVVGVALAGFNFWKYSNHDVPGFIDDPDVIGEAERACAEMRLGIEQARSLTSAVEREAAEAQAVLGMIESIRGVGESTLANDRPSLDWLDDWERLAQARMKGEPTPVVEGESITRRMSDLALDSGIDVCQVPRELGGDA